MTDRTCSVDDCERPLLARGWCGTHYARWRNRGTVDDPKPRQRPPCAVDGCTKPAKTRGWCVTHYSRWLRQGTVADPTPRRSAQCAVDGCDLPAKGRGWCDKHYLRWYRHGTTDHPSPPVSPDGLCIIDHCERLAAVRGMCQTHNYRLKMHGTVTLPTDHQPFGIKWCHGCKSYLPLTEFYEGKGSKGRMSPCKNCRAMRDKDRRKLNPARTRPSQNRKRRARLRAAKSEPYTAVEIADRDGWVCQKCRKRIGRTLRFPHPRSLSIDHILPVSQGGDDLKVNVQAVHLRCNASKGNRGIDQLRLIG